MLIAVSYAFLYLHSTSAIASMKHWDQNCKQFLRCGFSVHKTTELDSEKTSQKLVLLLSLVQFGFCLFTGWEQTNNTEANPVWNNPNIAQIGGKKGSKLWSPKSYFKSSSKASIKLIWLYIYLKVCWFPAQWNDPINTTVTHGEMDNIDNCNHTHIFPNWQMEHLGSRGSG